MENQTWTSASQSPVDPHAADADSILCNLNFVQVASCPYTTPRTVCTTDRLSGKETASCFLSSHDHRRRGVLVFT